MSAVIQTKETGAELGSGPASLSITTTSPVTAGSLIIIVASGYGAISVSDTAGNQYNTSASVLSIGSPRTSILRAIAATSATLTITVNYAQNGPGGYSLHFYEISGGYNALDVVGIDASEASSNPFSIATSQATRHANELVVLAQRVFWDQAGLVQTVTTPPSVEATLNSQEFVLTDGDIVTSAVWEVSSTGTQTGVITTTNQIPFTGTAQGLLIATFFNAGTLYSISGNAGVAGATVSYTSTNSGTGSVVASGTGDYSFANLANDTYTITCSKATYTFTPASKNVVISNGNQTGVNFTANSGNAVGFSPQDCRNYASFPNSGVVQPDGSVFYDLSNPATCNTGGLPVDSRAAGPEVDSRKNKPVNSRD